MPVIHCLWHFLNLDPTKAHLNPERPAAQQKGIGVQSSTPQRGMRQEFGAVEGHFWLVWQPDVPPDHYVWRLLGLVLP